MNNMLIACSIVVLMAVGACATSETDMPSGPTSPERFTTAFNHGDAAGLANLYTENAALLPPDARRVDGRQEIQKFWQGAFDAGVTDMTIEIVESEARGDIAYETGAYSLKAPGEDGELVAVSGKYIVVWKHGADGQWRLHRDIWNHTPAASEQ
jgi:uncharacterized protein (TIGR02246 family)